MNIVSYPNEILTTPCAPITQITEDVRLFAMQVIEFMKDESSLWGNVAGLAANQVGKSIRMFVINGEEENGSDSQVFINPEIIWTTRAPKEIHKEGCYSLANHAYYRTERPPSVTLKWQDLEGMTHEQRYNGIMAQIIAHECDHLNGKLCVDESVLKAELDHDAEFMRKKIAAMKQPVVATKCEECGDTGEVQDDEYENGQIVGVGTITKKCVCKKVERDNEEQE